jgi:uncharacterized glyoxalase superfamily protein PhnB
MFMVRTIPEGYHAVTTYLHVAHASNLIDFLKQAFDAVELERFNLPDGRIEHAEVRIGDSIVMLSDASDKYPALPTWVYLYVNDSDEAYRKALQAGAISLMAPADVYYGEHVGGVRDSSENVWWISTRLRDLSPEEIRKRLDAHMKQSS